MTDPKQPTPAQRRWMDLQFGMFCHFGINTFHDVEWSDGSLDQSVFNPTAFDPDQWCQAARDAGMNYICILTKHHDGFCNWPTAHSDYGVMHTPFKRDLIGAVAESARKAGLKLGFYYSLWDKRHDVHDDDGRYGDFMLAQLTELMTQYGEIVEVWFDGAWMKFAGSREEGPNVTTDEELIAAWRDEGAPRWRWDEVYALIKSHHPDCIVLNNTTTHFRGVPLWPVDARCGEKGEGEVGDQKVWRWQGEDVYLPLEIESTTSKQGPPGFFADGSWFWHEWDHSCATVEEVRGWQANARALDAVLLLNVPPMASGQLRPEDLNLLKQLGR